VLLGAAAVPAAAQIQRSAPAFPAAVSPWIGVMGYGTRQSAGGFDASYRGSITVGLRAEVPLTQRVGVLGNASISPFAKQRLEGPASTELRGDVSIARADLALGWRFIPRAPVFFYGGGGLIRASRPAWPDFDESVIEPRALVGLGYDKPAAGRWNFRVTGTAFFAKPADVDPLAWSGSGPVPPVRAKATAFDWAIELGARYRLRRGS
jgi:hypothetical protein